MTLAFSRIRRLLTRAHRLRMAIVVAVGQSALLLPIALLVRDVFDEHIPAKDETAIVVNGTLALALYLASGALGLVAKVMIAGTNKQATARLRHDLVQAIYKLPQAWHDRERAGRVHSIVVQDSERVDQMLGQLLTQVLPSSIVLAALSFVAVALNPLLFLVVVLGLPIPIGLAWWLGRRVRVRVHARHETFAKYSEAVQHALRAITLTKVGGAVKTEAQRVGRHIDTSGEAARAAVSAVTQQVVVTGSVAALTGILVLIVGGIAVARGTMTIGDLLSFYAVVALMLRQLQMIIPGVPAIITGVDSLERLEWLIGSHEHEPYAGTRPVDFQGGITLEGVTFGYGEQPVVREVSLSIAPGEHVALVGPNGAGKSTLVQLLLGLYRPQAGRLLVDGVPMEDADLGLVRRRLGVVLQDPIVFPGSVRDNITYGLDKVDDLDVRTAAERATAASFIENLPAGYDTDVGDEGGLLSGGQRQRIAIARALLGDRSLIVLDEPTTHLDDTSIAALMEQLASLPSAPTVITVTHDVDVAAHADRIVHLRDGRITSEEPGRRAVVTVRGVA